MLLSQDFPACLLGISQLLPSGTGGIVSSGYEAANGNCVSWDQEISLHQLPLASSSQWELPWFVLAGRSLGDSSVQEKLGRNCGGEGEADEKGLSLPCRVLSAEEEGWQGTGGT